MNYLNIGTSLFGDDGVFGEISGAFFDALGDFAGFFTTTDLGQIILVVGICVIVFSLITNLIMKKF